MGALPRDCRTHLERAYREASATGSERVVDSFYYEPFKTWFQIRIVPTTVGVVAHYRDVTAVHEAEIARVAAGEQLNQVFDATNDAVATLNRDWCFTFITGRRSNSFAPMEKCWAPTSGSASRPWPMRVPRFSITIDGPCMKGSRGEFEAHYPPPLNLWLHVVVRPSSDGIIVFFRDVTARKVYEQALRTSEERYRPAY